MKLLARKKKMCYYYPMKECGKEGAVKYEHIQIR